MMSDLAILHDQLTSRDGAERVAYELARTFDAPILAAYVDDEVVPEDVDARQLFNGPLANAILDSHWLLEDPYQMLQWEAPSEVYDYETIILRSSRTRPTGGAPVRVRRGRLMLESLGLGGERDDGPAPDDVSTDDRKIDDSSFGVNVPTLTGTHLLRRAIGLIYNRTVRPMTPHDLSISAGDITTNRRRFFDLQSEFPLDELREVEVIQDLVRDGDDVVVIGGGWGVTTVAAARAAGDRGSVNVYEAVGDFVSSTRWTVRHNHTPAKVDVHHAAVGEVTASSAEMFGLSDGRAVAPSEIPDADVWVLDCEGAEEQILCQRSPPDRALVEVHPQMCDASAVRSALDADNTREKYQDAKEYLAIKWGDA